MRTRMIPGFLLLALMACTGLAQDAGHAPGGMMGQGEMPMMQMMAMMQTMHPAIAVDDTAVYVVRGDQVIKLDKGSLQVIATGVLPAPPAAAMQGMGSMQGMQPAVPGTAGGAGRPGMAMRPDMQSMMGSMSSMSAYRFDQMFLQNMIRHHAGAIAMSRLAVRKASHPELRRFAQTVIDSQARQNKQFSVWLKDWYRTSTRSTAMPMDQGMVGRLQALSGRDFEIQYMQMMISHHQEAVQMAGMAGQRGAHPELKLAASKIATAQTAEIARLRRWLSAWYAVGR